MIKRRFFRVEHADGNDASDTSSSSSDSDSEVEEEHFEETEAEEDDDDVPQTREHNESPSSPSGYESEDSSAKEVEDESSDDSQSEEEQDAKKNKPSNKYSSRLLNAISDAVVGKNSKQFDEAYILKNKSVFKCRLCPKVICLTEESLNTHLKSKKHARSSKMLNEGRLKIMLNSDGEIEEDGETHAERLARTTSAAQKVAEPNKKNKGRQRQRNRLKKKKGDDSNVGKAKPSTDIPPKKRLKESKK